MTASSPAPPGSALSKATRLYPCFSRADLSFIEGRGSWLLSTEGQSYLDFATGIAVTGLGHNHPRLIEALVDQAMKVWHVSNGFLIPEQERVAQILCSETFADRVFFNNSGAEALETAIKTARRHHFSEQRPERWRIVTFAGAFHGRTLGTLAAGGQQKYLEGFGQSSPGFDQAPFGDIDALEAICGDETAAILIEPIQGESGVRVLSPDKLAAIRDLCDRRGILLVFDEVQTGVGRTGHLFAYQATEIAPDILASAKGLGNGFPVAACLATEKAASGMTNGTHGSTFGGNPLAMAVTEEVLKIVLSPGFLECVRLHADLLRFGLNNLVAEFPNCFAEVRGQGLLLGIKCEVDVRQVARAARVQGLLTVVAGDNVLRILPPLNVKSDEIDEGLVRLAKAARRIGATK